MCIMIQHCDWFFKRFYLFNGEKEHQQGGGSEAKGEADSFSLWAQVAQHMSPSQDPRMVTGAEGHHLTN